MEQVMTWTHHMGTVALWAPFYPPRLLIVSFRLWFEKAQLKWKTVICNLGLLENHFTRINYQGQLFRIVSWERLALGDRREETDLRQCSVQCVWPCISMPCENELARRVNCIDLDRTCWFVKRQNSAGEPLTLCLVNWDVWQFKRRLLEELNWPKYCIFHVFMTLDSLIVYPDSAVVI